MPSGPCSFIVKKGRVGKVLNELVTDLRQLMAPNTFSKLKESKRNSAQDYVQVAGSLGASHLIRVSSNEKNVPHLHLSRVPAGPCFDFRVERFSLISDLRKNLQSGGIALSKGDEQFAPVAILNGFKNSSNEFAALLCEALKGLIPGIDINKINVKTCRRVILFNFTPETNMLSIRHYRVNLAKRTVASLPSVNADPQASCGVMLNSRKTSRIPNLGSLVSISDLVTKSLSASDEQLAADSQIEIVGSKNAKKTSLSLTEIGPRIEAAMSRILSGVEEGTVLYSQFAPETVGSAIVKKKPKRVHTKDKEAPKKRRRMDTENAEEDGYESMMSE